MCSAPRLCGDMDKNNMPKKREYTYGNDVLRDKIYGCWLGKNVGGTLGAPIEGRCDFMDIKWFPELGRKGLYS